MSLRNRARHLQRETGWTYQQALARLRALGAAPADLRRRTGWSLERCDRELAAAPPPHPIEVAELPPPPLDPLELACERLRVLSNTRTVLLLDGAGRALACAGSFEGRMLVAVMPRPHIPEPLIARVAQGFEGVDLGDGERLHFAAVGARAVLAIRYDGETSLGLIRLRLRAALPELERLLAEPASSAPPRSGGAAGGTPAHMAETVAALRRRTR